MVTLQWEGVLLRMLLDHKVSLMVQIFLQTIHGNLAPQKIQVVLLRMLGILPLVDVILKLLYDYHSWKP